MFALHLKTHPINVLIEKNLWIQLKETIEMMLSIENISFTFLLYIIGEKQTFILLRGQSLEISKQSDCHGFGHNKAIYDQF
jgi:hypothetical protein